MHQSPVAAGGTMDMTELDRLFMEHGLETPLDRMARKVPVSVSPDTPLEAALGTMHARQVGSLLVLDGDGTVLGILTRRDVLERVALPQVSMACAVRQVMSSPVHTLDAADTLEQAALLMARHGLHHVPVTEGGRVVGLLSGHDLLALQRHSVSRVGAAITASGDVGQLADTARQIRAFAVDLLHHGVGARQVSELLSRLNDRLTDRLLQIVAAEEDLDLQRACWLAFGSEGRGEQTIVTDQDNGLIFESEQPSRDRDRWLALGQRVNDGLSACGYPPCKGQVMAGNPDCCQTAPGWCDRIAGWIEHGGPQDLLKACIYFDLRPVAGRRDLARPLRELVTRGARVPRFLKQMADNALRNPAPLSWLGAVETRKHGGRPMLDLKHHGTMLFVDAARLYALKHGIGDTGTRQRFEAIAGHLRVPPHESEAWVRGFEFLQMLRLQTQAARDPQAPWGPNMIDVDSLNDIDRRVLKETLRVAQSLHQRMQLDYQR